VPIQMRLTQQARLIRSRESAYPVALLLAIWIVQCVKNSRPGGNNVYAHGMSRMTLYNIHALYWEATRMDADIRTISNL